MRNGALPSEIHYFLDQVHQSSATNDELKKRKRLMILNAILNEWMN